ncbi:MAG TPA: hypothetical protein DCZ13_07155 [Porticoccaceae bacterium]|nr:hypothetical protein [Porticoccaceae bacterium]
MNAFPLYMANIVWRIHAMFPFVGWSGTYFQRGLSPYVEAPILKRNLDWSLQTGGKYIDIATQ